MHYQQHTLLVCDGQTHTGVQDICLSCTLSPAGCIFRVQKRLSGNHFV